MKKALVVIPTYNEAGNIDVVIPQLMNLDLKCRLDVLIRDDKSPDGTPDLVKKLMKIYPGRIFLEQGDKKGLGDALRKSFDSVLSNYDHEIIATMDGDQSHQPADLAKLINAVHDGKDVAIGSRYVKGGMIPGDWPAFFLVRTLIATRVARWVGGINEDIHELTTNMRAMTRQVLKKVEYNRIELSGYAFQIMMTNELTRRKEWDIVELPIAFRSRDAGSTKSRASDVIEFFVVAYKLNPDSPAKETLRYLTVGASGAVVNVGTLYALSRLMDDPNMAILSLLAIQTSVVWNFFAHSTFTFRSRRRQSVKLLSLATLADFGKYQVASAAAQLLTISVFLTLSNAGLYFVFAQATGIIIAFFFNYYIARNYIWTIKQSDRTKTRRIVPRFLTSTS